MRRLASLLGIQRQSKGGVEGKQVILDQGPVVGEGGAFWKLKAVN